ncbi:hypothetical protein M9458_024179, partial [Cirrhinus mrigala]
LLTNPSSCNLKAKDNIFLLCKGSLSQASVFDATGAHRVKDPLREITLITHIKT